MTDHPGPSPGLHDQVGHLVAAGRGPNAGVNSTSQALIFFFFFFFFFVFFVRLGCWAGVRVLVSAGVLFFFWF